MVGNSRQKELEATGYITVIKQRIINICAHLSLSNFCNLESQLTNGAAHGR